VRFRAAAVKGSVRLFVEDSGPGIPPESRERLFERYYERLGLISQGTGIGLHISKTLIDVMGAKIWLDDSYNSGVPGFPGTRFVIDLKSPPIVSCSRSPTGFCDGNCDCKDNTAATSDNGRGASSSSSNQDTTMPSKCDCENILHYSNSVHPIHTVEVKQSHFPYEENNEITCEFASKSDMKTTGSTANKEMTVDLEAGTAPPTLQNQAKAVEGTTGQEISNASKPGEEDEEESLPEQLSVLFVDDDKTLRKLFCRSARRLNPIWKVDEAHNGETALELVKKQHYDLIFMDQYMESTSKQLLGTEAVRQMRESGDVDDSCIICGLSANEEKERFLMAGANYFLMKPIPCSKAGLKSQIVRVLEESTGRPKEYQDDISFVGI